MKTQIIFCFLCALHFNLLATTDEASHTLPSAQVLAALSELEAIVLRHNDINKESEHSMVTRSKTSALLPKLSIFGDVGRDNAVIEKRVQDVTESVLHKNGRDYGMGINLTFDLGGLLYSDVELELKRMVVKNIEKRQELIAALHKTYFRYLRLKNALASATSPSQAALKLEQLEVVATLNSMSGGAFSQMGGLL